jgi:hypothetical protein
MPASLRPLQETLQGNGSLGALPSTAAFAKLMSRKLVRACFYPRRAHPTST